MLSLLHIENIAVISQADITFEFLGFHILLPDDPQDLRLTPALQIPHAFPSF